MHQSVNGNECFGERCQGSNSPAATGTLSGWAIHQYVLLGANRRAGYIMVC